MKSAARIFTVVLALALTGIAFADGPPERRHHHPRGPLELALLPEVQQELKLDDSRIEKLTQRRTEMREKATALGPQLPNLTPAQRDARFRALQDEERRKVAEVLDGWQLKRLKELELQTIGARGLARPDVAEKLKLTADQKQRIQGLLQAERDSFHQMFQGFSPKGNLSPEMREELRRKMSEMREVRTATDARLREVLTEKQKQKFESLKGAPFKFADPPPRGG